MDSPQPFLGKLLVEFKANTFSPTPSCIHQTETSLFNPYFAIFGCFPVVFKIKSQRWYTQMYFCLKIFKITEFHLKCVLPPSSTQFFLVNFLLLHPPTPDLDAQGNAHCPQCSTMSTSTVHLAQCTAHQEHSLHRRERFSPVPPSSGSHPAPAQSKPFDLISVQL